MVTIRDKQRKWTDEEVTYLQTNYGKQRTSYIAKALNRNCPGVLTKANRMGLIIPRDYFCKNPCKNKDLGYVANDYRRKSRNGKKIQEHILIWESKNGKVPKGMQIHHINEDKLDNRIENLMCVTAKEHRKLHRIRDYAKIKEEYAQGKIGMIALGKKYNTTSSMIHYIIHSED